jgi:hypothetical protein
MKRRTDAGSSKNNPDRGDTSSAIPGYLPKLREDVGREQIKALAPRAELHYDTNQCFHS